MILDEKIEVIVNSTTLKHYREKGYDVKLGNKIEVDIQDLTPSSSYKIRVKCDICGCEKELSYHSYIKNIKNYNLYTCSTKCALVKNKQTNLKKYGDENYHNIEKTKTTNLERYGCENVFQNKEIKEIIKKTNLEKYGDESHNRNDVVKRIKKEIFLEKYGVNCNLNVEKQKELSKIKKLAKYGNLNNHDKLKDTFLEKYGVEHPSMVKEFLNKRVENYKKTIEINFLEKYKNYKIINADFENDKFNLNVKMVTFLK